MGAAERSLAEGANDMLRFIRNVSVALLAIAVWMQPVTADDQLCGHADAIDECAEGSGDFCLWQDGCITWVCDDLDEGMGISCPA